MRKKSYKRATSYICPYTFCSSSFSPLNLATFTLPQHLRIHSLSQFPAAPPYFASEGNLEASSSEGARARMEDDDILEIDSPLEQPVDIDEDEIDELLLDGRAAASSSSFSRTMSGKPIHYPAKAEDRKTMMLYPQSLPYKCESLEEFDARMDFICQRLVDCVRTRE